MKAAWLWLGGALSLSLILGAPGADAGTWKVGRGANDCDGTCNFHDNSIGSEVGGGIDIAMRWPAVVVGDTVLVYPNPSSSPADAYFIRFQMKSGVVLKSAYGPDTTFIRGFGGAEPAIRMVGCTASTVIDGFTIWWDATPLNSFGGGIAAYVSSGTIRNNLFRNCLAATGAGIYMQLCDLVIENNVFTNNSCAAGGGVIAMSASSPEIRNNTFVRCSAPVGYEAAGIYAVSSSYALDRNIFLGSVGAPAIFCGGDNTPTVTNNIFWENMYGPSGGTCVDSTGTSGNRSVDPALCDPYTTSPRTSSFWLCLDSPASLGGGDYIGFTASTCGFTCGPTTVNSQLQLVSWGRVKARYR